MLLYTLLFSKVDTRYSSRICQLFEKTTGICLICQHPRLTLPNGQKLWETPSPFKGTICQGRVREEQKKNNRSHVWILQGSEDDVCWRLLLNVGFHGLLNDEACFFFLMTLNR